MTGVAVPVNGTKGGTGWKWEDSTSHRGCCVDEWENRIDDDSCSLVSIIRCVCQSIILLLVSSALLTLIRILSDMNKHALVVEDPFGGVSSSPDYPFGYLCPLTAYDVIAYFSTFQRAFPIDQSILFIYQ